MLSFGGPAGQIATMHRILVDEKRWIGETRFLHALNYCMLLPGPEAQQMATYVGWLLHGWRGGVAEIFEAVDAAGAPLAICRRRSARTAAPGFPGSRSTMSLRRW